MTKEQVQKHGDIIKWFCDNPEKGVWVKTHKDGLWQLEYEPTFTVNIYVQNDEYSEFRKAHADGKTIQFKKTHIGTHEITPHQWVDWNSYNFCFNKDTEYRIKPDEPKFKVGDWVYTEEGYLGKVTSHVSNDFYAISGMKRNAKISRLWTPKEGDIIIGIRKNLPIIIFTYKEYKLQVDNFVEFDKVIPYIGQPLEEMK